jgi:membrane associated rhomboid family serine protease
MGIYDREYSRDDDRPNGFQLRLGNSVINTLIVINVVVFLANAFTADEGVRGSWLNRLLSVTPETLTHPWLWWQFLTYGFAHLNVQHILFNMLGLWFFGKTLEERFGPKELLRFFLVAIVLGGIAWSVRGIALPNAQLGPLLGASGGVTAVIMLFVFLYPHRTVLLMLIPVPAWLMGVVLVAGDLFGNMHPNAIGKPQIAFDVHLVGAAFAAAYFWFGWNLSRVIPSLDWLSSMPRNAKRLLRSKPDLRIHQPDDHESYREQDEQADRALAKLHELGEAALTQQERQILEDYSRRMRQKLR